jgi:hypothetical protein
MRERSALPAFSPAGRWGRRGVGRLAGLLLTLAASLASIPAARPGEAPRVVIDWHDGRLSVRAYEAPWEAVLPALQRHTGVEIQVKGPLAGTLTQTFDALPLEQGLRRLFRQANVLWFYAPGGEPGAVGVRLVRVWLVPKEETAPEARQVRSLPSGLTAAEKRAMPDVVEKPAEGVSRADEATPEEDRAVEEPDPAERLRGLDALAREGHTEALEQGLLDPDEAVRVRALELLEQGEPEGQ